jgi:prepilin-type N-terminal cleavage/methylation domain-containing protein/prepilin-type processing-associated H-X9-DG protein
MNDIKSTESSYRGVLVPHNARAFTLLELLIVIGIIGVLIAIIAPALEKANERARNAVCGENLHQISIALNTYAGEFNNAIPVGPSIGSTVDPARTWDTIGSNQLWIASTARYDGLGVLTTGGWISNPRVLACPSDDDHNLKDNLAKTLGGPSDVYGSYAYRQLNQRATNRLTMPGNNTFGNAANAIVCDWQSLGPAPYAHNSHDSGEYVNVLYSDGHIQFYPNDDLGFGGRASDYAAIPTSYLRRLDQIWINLDWADTKPVSTAPQLP